MAAVPTVGWSSVTWWTSVCDVIGMGNGSVERNPNANPIPANALLTEGGLTILTEDGQFILT